LHLFLTLSLHDALPIFKLLTTLGISLALALLVIYTKSSKLTVQAAAENLNQSLINEANTEQSLSNDSATHFNQASRNSQDNNLRSEEHTSELQSPDHLV